MPPGAACWSATFVMPGLGDESRAILEWVARELSPDTCVGLAPAAAADDEATREEARRLASGVEEAAARCCAHHATQTRGALPSIAISRAAQPRPLTGIILIPGSEPKAGMSGSPAFVQSFGPSAIRPAPPSGTVESWSRTTAFSPKPVTIDSAIAFVPRIQSSTRTAARVRGRGLVAVARLLVRREREQDRVVQQSSGSSPSASCGRLVAVAGVPALRPRVLRDAGIADLLERDQLVRVAEEALPDRGEVDALRPQREQREVAGRRHRVPPELRDLGEARVGGHLLRERGGAGSPSACAARNTSTRAA